MRELGLQAYRFSIAWPRIYPQGDGALNAAGLDFYDRLVDDLLAAGITPFVTLYHWDLPQALQDRGGWANRESVEHFRRYVDTVSQRLGDRVRYWITHNEPWVAAAVGNLFGRHAPGLQDLETTMRVGHHLLLSHGLTVPVLRANSAPGTQVGITLNLNQIYPASESTADRAAADRADIFGNRWFLDPLFRGTYPDGLRGAAFIPVQDGDLATISTPLDFLGINNYTRTVVKAGPASDGSDDTHVRPEGSAYTAMGWEVAPEGLHDLLLRLHTDYTPPVLYITENGAAFDDQVDPDGQIHDPRRVAYYQDYLSAACRAVAEGVPLKGYFAWSLLDNFEWGEGYTKRFGLIYVDYATQQRTIKDSGRWYARTIQANGPVA
jgi:beta-glucosidase